MTAGTGLPPQRFAGTPFCSFLSVPFSMASPSMPCCAVASLHYWPAVLHCHSASPLAGSTRFPLACRFSDFRSGGPVSTGFDWFWCDLPRLLGLACLLRVLPGSLFCPCSGMAVRLLLLPITSPSCRSFCDFARVATRECQYILVLLCSFSVQAAWVGLPPLRPA